MVKKTLNIENPALQFISKPEEAAEAPAVQQTGKARPPEGYRMNPLYIEKKTRRLQLLIRPSLYEKLKRRAGRDKTTINDALNQILEEMAEDDT